MENSRKRFDLLTMAKEAVDKVQASFRARKDEKALEAWIIDREQEVAKLELEISEAKASKDFHVEKIIDAIDSLALEQRRLQQAKDLLKELF